MKTWQDIKNHDENLVNYDNLHNGIFRNSFDNILQETISAFENIKNELLTYSQLQNLKRCNIKQTYEEKQSPRACIKQDYEYEIKIPVPFMRYLYVYADLISDEYIVFWKDKFDWKDEFELKNSKQEVRDALFASWSLIILCHETAHIFNGHLDLLNHKNLITKIGLIDSEAEYIELITAESNDADIQIMQITENGDLWKALEAEADAFAIQTAAIILFEMNSIKIILENIKEIQHNAELIYKCIGHILIPLFYFYDLVSSKNDTRHPKPFERAYISATAFNQFISSKGGSKEDFRKILDIILKSYFEILDYLGILTSVSEALTASLLMMKIPSILDKNEIQKFRKKS